MNIDMRNVSGETLDNIEKIMSEKGINTGAKAVRYAINNYFTLEDIIESDKKEKYKLQQEIQKLKGVIRNTEDLKKNLREFLTEI